MSGRPQATLAGCCWLVAMALLQACSTAPRGDGEAARAAASPGAAARPAYHTVRRGETLSQIARGYGLSLANLLEANTLANPDRIEIGDRLSLPGYAMPGASQRAFVWPLERWAVTSEFGARGGRHQGIDLGSPKGATVRAAGSGVVAFAGRKRGYGRVVILQHAGGVQTLYAHNRKNLVRRGEHVSQGQSIARVGQSGRATGSHLHFEFIIGGHKRNARLYVWPALTASSASVR